MPKKNYDLILGAKKHDGTSISKKSLYSLKSLKSVKGCFLPLSIYMYRKITQK